MQDRLNLALWSLQPIQPDVYDASHPSHTDHRTPTRPHLSSKTSDGVRVALNVNMHAYKTLNLRLVLNKTQQERRRGRRAHSSGLTHRSAQHLLCASVLCLHVLVQNALIKPTKQRSSKKAWWATGGKKKMNQPEDDETGPEWAPCCWELNEKPRVKCKIRYLLQ